MSNEKSLKLYPSTNGWSVYINNGEYVSGNLETAERLYELYNGSNSVAPWHHVPGGCKDCINFYLGARYIRLNLHLDVYDALKKAGFSSTEIRYMHKLYRERIMVQEPPVFEVGFGCGNNIWLQIDGVTVYGDDVTKANRVAVAVGAPTTRDDINNAQNFLASMWASQKMRDDKATMSELVDILKAKSFDNAVDIVSTAAEARSLVSFMVGTS